MFLIHTWFHFFLKRCPILLELFLVWHMDQTLSFFPPKFYLFVISPTQFFFQLYSMVNQKEKDKLCLFPDVYIIVPAPFIKKSLFVLVSSPDLSFPIFPCVFGYFYFCLILLGYLCATNLLFSLQKFYFLYSNIWRATYTLP